MKELEPKPKTIKGVLYDENGYPVDLSLTIRIEKKLDAFFDGAEKLDERAGAVFIAALHEIKDRLPHKKQKQIKK